MGEDARRGCGWGRCKWVGRYVSKEKEKGKEEKKKKKKLRTKKKKGGKERGKETRGVVRPLGVGEGGVGGVSVCCVSPSCPPLG